MSCVLKWKVDKFCTYTTSLLLQISENGGNDDQVFDKIYEIITQTPCPTQLLNFRVKTGKHL